MSGGSRFTDRNGRDEFIGINILSINCFYVFEMLKIFLIGESPINTNLI
ncbi:hypothetical protein EU98_0306 [Prochlorococcus marinus str. MIT 9314]|uniref:Uncharacterized protein n=1 Tax=Prochlorococcus marinus str. MIT 9314 TaxID=167548 RepID=A0A0A2AL59_PROMR|nr:hypothetical protein EU98_0306 [Prochlorococcus marinus str. MIT 9314]